MEYFAISHGKGVVDGIGGTVKRAIWRHIRSERSHITTPQEYSALAKQLCPNIQVEFVAKSEIDQQFAFLGAKWEGVMAVPQTHYRARSTEERRRRKIRRKKNAKSRFFYFARCVRKLALYSDVIHLFDWKSAVEHDDGV